jgi:glycosyltransferase involved in cell wall biosynthesis
VQAAVSDRGTLAEDLRWRGAGVIVLPWRPEIAAVGGDVAAARLLARVLRRGRWEIVHTHGNKAGVIARPLAAARGLRVVHSPHGFAFTTQLRRDRSGQALRRAVTLAVERVASPAARAIVCVSEAERADAIRDRVASPDRLRVVHNGVAPLPPAEPDSRLRAFGDGLPLIGYAGRLSPEKGPLQLLEALTQLRARGIRFRAAILGDGPLADEVRARAGENGLAGNVLVAPFAPTVHEILPAFDVYVLPSLWESLPILLLEAMSAGVAVLAAEVGGVAEAVVHGETGLLYRPGDPMALADGLERLLGDAELRARLGAAGRERQAAEFSLPAMLDGIERVYAEAVA